MKPDNYIKTHPLKAKQIHKSIVKALKQYALIFKLLKDS